MKALLVIVGLLLTLPGLLLVVQGVSPNPYGDGFAEMFALLIGIPMVLFGGISLFMAHLINRQEAAEANDKAKEE